MDELNEYFSVIFHNVKDSYSSTDIIKCQFTVKDFTTITEPANCFIGILLVAWDSLQSAAIKKKFTLVEFESRTGVYNLVFDPTDPNLNCNFKDDEFYQFCFYDIETKDVLGASCPFQVFNSNNDNEGSLVHIGLGEEEVTCDKDGNTNQLTLRHKEDESWWLKGGSVKPLDGDLGELSWDFEEDTVLVHNKTTLMEDALVNAAKDKEEALMATKLKFESDLKQCSSEKEEIIKKTEAEVENLKQKNKLLAESESLLKQNLVSSQNEFKQVEKLAAENAKKSAILSHNHAIEKETLTKTLSDKEAEYKDRIYKIKAELNAKIEAAELRCDNLNKSLIAEKERVQTMEVQYEEIILSLREKIEQFGIKENESATETSRTLADLQKKLSEEIAQKHEYFNEIYKLNQSVESLTEENKLKETLINAEREKVAAFSLQQEEMTSRLCLESEKLRSEIDNLKSHEKSLVGAHQKESSCHANRIAEMESIAKDERMKYKNDVMILTDELNDKINCINLFEARIRENEDHFMEAHKQEKLELSDIIDELKAKLSEVEHESLQLSDEARKTSLCKNCENGSKHALHVAIAHMQKQLNIYKKEKEKFCCQESSTANSELLKQNEEFRLRLCMGKTAFDKQYLECQKMRNEVSKLKKSIHTGVNENNNTEAGVARHEYDSLLLQYNNLKADNSKRIDNLLAEMQKINEQKEESEKEMINTIEDKNNAVKLNEELRAKLSQLVGHYEGKLNLLTEENSMLKTQIDALLQGAGVYNAGINNCSPDILPTATSVKPEQPNLIQMDRDVIPKLGNQNKDGINHPDNKSRNIVDEQPNGGNSSKVKRSQSSVVEKQPTLMPDIRYPPTMLQNNQGHLYPILPQEISRSPRQQIATPVVDNDPLIRAEPPSQVIPDRSSLLDQPSTVVGRGRHFDSPIHLDNAPTQQCPICELDFPYNLNEASKNEHVNSHFEQQ